MSVSRDDYVKSSQAAQYWQQFPPDWRPEPGEWIVGTVEKLNERKALDGGWAPLVQVHLDNGDRVNVFVTQTELLAKMVKCKPRVGDRIKILFEGTKPTPGPGMKPTNVYRLAVRDGVTEPAPES